MATIVADQTGKLSGKFTIPNGIRAGTKTVEAIGMGGNVARTTFTGGGTLVNETRRRVSVVVQVQSDPLAQTFTLTEARHICALDLWFANRGTHDVTIQIRNTQVGFPGADVFVEQRIKPVQIKTDGTPTRINFDSVAWLEANREYAIVVLTDDADASLHVAELGGFDQGAQKVITSQAYQVGVLLSSSNASTWTAHQDRDLCFRLHAAKFTSQTGTVDLGNVNVANASDFIARMNIDIPATGASAQVLATAPGGEVFRMTPGQALAMPSRVTGDVNVSVSMAGTDKVSPVIYPGLQFIAGSMQETGNYVSRAFPVGDNARIAVTFEALTPGTSSIVIEIERNDGTWQAIPLTSGVQVGDGWVERSHILTGFSAVQSRVRVTMNGNAQYRPRARKFRAVATE